MADDLDPCVRAILCALSAPLRAAIRGALDTAIALMTVELGVVRALLLQAQIITAPIDVARSALQLVKDGFTGSLSLLPGELFAGCPDLGDLSIGFSLDTAKFTQFLDAKLLEMRDLLAYVDELVADVDRIETEIALYQAIVIEMVTNCD